MTRTNAGRSTRPRALCAAALASFAGAAWAQPATPAPPAEPAASLPAETPPGPDGRRGIDGPPTALAFKGVAVSEIIPFIVEMTGKVVMPQQSVLTRKITVLNDRPIPRDRALDLVFIALQQNDIAVVETPTTVTLREISEVTRQDVPVIGPETSVLERLDLGTMVEKVFSLKHSTAKNVGEILKPAVPDYAKLTVDEESNQIAVLGNISLLQRIERLIASLDRPSAGALQTETFRLRYADAELIKGNIEELFGAGTASTGRRNAQNQANRQQQNQGFRFPGQQQQAEATPSTSDEIRVSANTQQNSVTVVADPAVLEQVREQIQGEWDLPLPDEAVIPKIYELRHTDPVKVRDLLEGLFGRGTSTAARTQGGGGQQGQAQGGTTTGSSQGVGRLAGQFSFQAIPEAGRLVVVAKSPDNIAVIDKIVEGLDQPQTVGLPAIIELKHASADDLAEQLNALLAQDGTLAQVRRAETGLSESSATSSPFASQAIDAQGNTQVDQTPPDTLAFWWQRSRTPTDRRSASNLIAQVRIVPVWRQNALMVIAPPEYKDSIVELVSKLDKPGRQVLIAAIVAEVARDDAESLGLRWSSQTITPSNPDNSIGIGANATGSDTNFATSLFDTSVLNVNADLNVLLQALAQKTRVAILSEPKVFTSDNQEAEFFDGQDIPFVTDSQVNTQGNLVQSFDYRAVGIQLRARPRITLQGDVDLRVNLELSSIVPGQTLFGGFVVDRRETTTQLIVKDKQTIVISGILRQEESDIVRKIPILGDIPLLGALFTSREKSLSNTELLVFITPIVVVNTEANESLNAPYKERLDDLRGTLRKEQESGRDGPRPLAPDESATPTGTPVGIDEVKTDGPSR